MVCPMFQVQAKDIMIFLVTSKISLALFMVGDGWFPWKPSFMKEFRAMTPKSVGSKKNGTF